MDNNNFFSFPRIAMVMKREIMENWNTNMFRLIGLYTAFAMIMVGNMWTMSSRIKASFDGYCNNIMGASVFVIGILALVYASYIMENMTTKEKRISFLMLPATMVEKFVARFLMVTIGFILSIIAAMLLAEITRYIMLPLFNLPDDFQQSVIPQLLSKCVIDGENALNGPMSGYSGWLAGLCGFSWIVWNHSLYILGGSYWYKKPLLKTLGAIMLIMIVCSFCFTHIIGWIGTDHFCSLAEWVSENCTWMTLDKLLSLGVAFFSGFTMLNWWLSYKLFARAQAIKPKFHLL